MTEAIYQESDRIRYFFFSGLETFADNSNNQKSWFFFLLIFALRTLCPPPPFPLSTQMIIPRPRLLNTNHKFQPFTLHIPYPISHTLHRAPACSFPIHMHISIPSPYQYKQPIQNPNNRIPSKRQLQPALSPIPALMQ